jgi:hypothetical protein
MNTRVKLGEIVKIRPGYLARKGVKPVSDGTHWLLQIRDFTPDRGALDASSLVRFSPKALASALPLQPGDVLFLARGSKNFAYAISDIPAPTLAASYFFVLRPCASVSPAYLAWFLSHPATLRKISLSATSGAHMPVVRRADLEDIEVPVPPLSVQHAIVELDNLRHQEQALLKELAHRKNELLTTVCMTAAQSLKKIGELS